MLSRLTLAATVIVVGLFSLTAGPGVLASTPAWHRVVVFAAVTGLAALIIPPPLVGEQRSLIDAVVHRVGALTWGSRSSPDSPTVGDLGSDEDDRLG